ncbi:hypothetical protein P43SY_007126 [Pythium insidiosum]|uniref:YHYH domain-containing protein n=1 Tax=Pythium insidiosum TaxID=114742 RepID=A0AAD5Q829_PYTIN|nr:hypothetical protein P43SY_007126 [Pythium insidiosum]
MIVSLVRERDNARRLSLRAKCRHSDGIIRKLELLKRRIHCPSNHNGAIDADLRLRDIKGREPTGAGPKVRHQELNEVVSNTKARQVKRRFLALYQCPNALQDDLSLRATKVAPPVHRSNVEKKTLVRIGDRPAALLIKQLFQILGRRSLGAAKVKRVYSDHSDGVFGVGETINVLVDFTSPVQVVGTPTLELSTGCHDSSCHVREIQRLRCQATDGKFAIAFADQRVVNIPWNASAYTLRHFLQRMTKIDDVVVTYLQQEDRACTYLGNEITVTFETVNMDGVDGWLIGRETLYDVSVTTASTRTQPSGMLELPMGSSLVKVNSNRNIPLRRGIVDILVTFSDPVIDDDEAAELQLRNVNALVGPGIRRASMSPAFAATLTLPQLTLYRALGDGETIQVSNDATSLRSRLLEFPELQSIGIVSITKTAKKNGVRFVLQFDDTQVLEVPDAIVPVVSDVCAPLLPSSSDATPERLVQQSCDTKMVFQYDIAEGDSALDLDYAGAAIVVPAPTRIARRSRTPTLDANVALPGAASLNRLAATKNLRIDGSPVVITDIVSDSAAGTYGVAYPPDASPPGINPGEIQFRLLFSRPVKFVSAPTMELATGSIQANGVMLPNRVARFISQPTSREAKFIYRVQEGDFSNNLAFANLNVLASAKILCISTSSKYEARKTLPRLTIAAPLNPPIVVDALSVPTTVKLSSTHPDGTFGAGEAIDIQVTFSKQVILQTGLNRNHNRHAQNPAALEYMGNVYVLWTERDDLRASGPPSESLLYLRVFNSDTLQELSLAAPLRAPINRFAPGSFVGTAALVNWKGQLYAAWDENGKLYCAVFGGLAAVAAGTAPPWTLIPNMGANKNLAMRASDAQLLVQNLQLVLVWREIAVVKGAAVGQIRVAQRNDDFDAPLWIFHDGNHPNFGLNRDPTQDARQPHAIVFRGSMFVAWSEYNLARAAYEVIIARRFIQSRDESVWQFLTKLTTPPDDDPLTPFMSVYRPRFAIRRKGMEDLALYVTFHRDTPEANVSVSVYGQVYDTEWALAGANTSIAQQLWQQQTRPSGELVSQLPNTKSLELSTCGNTLFASWTQERTVASPMDGLATWNIQWLQLASLAQDLDMAAAWRPVFRNADAPVNHNTSFDAGQAAWVCSWATGAVGVFWTEFDGITTKLRFRHQKFPQFLTQQQNVTWGETTSGNPLLLLATGTTPPGSAFLTDRSGLRSHVLSFLYVVQPGHSTLDLDATDRDAFVLNGAALRDYLDQIPDVTLFPRTVDLRSLSYNNNLRIDTNVPVVTDVSSSTLSGEYGVGERILIEVTFSAPVVVQSIPVPGASSRARLGPVLYLRSDELHLHSDTDSPALYLSGSGTVTLVFEYITTFLDYCDKLEYVRTSSLDIPIVNGQRTASIRRASTFPTSDAVLTLPAPRSARSLSGNRAIAIRPSQPRVVDVTSTAPDGVYASGDSIPITVRFSLPVLVFGWPVIDLDTGRDVPSEAVYVSGNGTTTLTFEYAVDHHDDNAPSGDMSDDLDVVDDRDGNLVLNYVKALRVPRQAMIKRLSTMPVTDAILSLPAPGFPGSLSANKNLKVDTSQPRIVNVRTTTPDGTYDVGDTIDIFVEFSRAVKVIPGVGQGIADEGLAVGPYLVLNIPSEDRRLAVYKAGSGTSVLHFSYIVTTGDDTKGAALDTLDTSAFRVRPFLMGRELSQPPAKVLCMSSKPVQPASLVMPRPGVPLRVDAVRSLVGNGHKLFLRTDGFRVMSLLADIASGETVSPGQRVVISVVFTDKVVVQGVPRLQLNANAGTPPYANYVSGSGSSTLQFAYVVNLGDGAAELEATSPRALELPLGSIITDINGGYVPLKLGPPRLPGSLSFMFRIGVSSLPPVVQAVRGLVPNGLYGVGDTIDLAVQFSRRVALVPTPAATDAAASLPSLMLQLANGLTRAATYVSGDRTTTLRFRLQVLAGDNTPSATAVDARSLEYTSINSLIVPVGRQLFALATTPTLLVNAILPVPGAAGSLSASSTIDISSAPPTVQRVDAESRNATYTLGDLVRIRVRFSFRVVVAAADAPTCALELSVGGGRSSDPAISPPSIGMAWLVGGSTTRTLVFEYRVGRGDRARQLDYKSAQSLRSCVIQQFSASPSLLVDLTLPPPGSSQSLSANSRLRVDWAAPRVLSVSSVLPNGAYGAGQVVDLTVSFSQAVRLYTPPGAGCVPRLGLAIAFPRPRLPPSAVYTSGSGTAVWTFRYTTVEGEQAFPLAYAGIDALYVEHEGPRTTSCVVQAATSSSPDEQWVALRLPVPRSTGSLSNNRDIRIDAADPPRVIAVRSASPNGVYTIGDTVSVTVVFSGPVVVTGTPFLLLDVGRATPAAAMYAGGTQTAELRFDYAVQVGDATDRLDYTRCPDSARRRPRRREFDKLVICDAGSNALQLGPGGRIQRLATLPTTDAVLDLPEVSQWPRVRVMTAGPIVADMASVAPGEDVAYVTQVQQTTRIPSDDAAAELALQSIVNNEISLSQRQSSLFLYTNSFPAHDTPLRVMTREQRYFIELMRFPSQQTNPLSVTAITTPIGVLLDGIPIQRVSLDIQQAAASNKRTDECGGLLLAVNGVDRYVYTTVPTCFIKTLVPDFSASSRPFLMLGYAFDGFPIFYFYDEDGQLPVLDECNGMLGRDGMYRYHLVPPSGDPSSSVFMPCLRGINNPQNNGDAARLIQVFRYPVDVRQVNGLTLSELSRLDGLVVDQNPSTLRGVATWLNPSGVSVVYTSSTMIVRSNGIPAGKFGPFPNAYNRYRVRPQEYVFEIPRQPVAAQSTTPLPPDRPVGVMLNGVPFFSSQSLVYRGNVLSSQSPAIKLFDSCNGLVDSGGNYRYYASPDCFLRELGASDTPGTASPLIGFALDGFPVYGPYAEDGQVATGLDACNGRIGDDGTYRYHVTLNRAPYIIGCFRGTPRNANIPADVASLQTAALFHSLSFIRAIRISSTPPRVEQVFTNKHPGRVVSPTTATAVFEATKSTPTLSVFMFSITPAAVSSNIPLEFGFDFRSRIVVPPQTTIKRLAAVPMLDADLSLVSAERNTRFASKHQFIRDINVVLRGLYHPHGEDLRVRLFHQTEEATIFERCCGKATFGQPDIQRRINTAQVNIYPTNPTSGVGWDYSFRDRVGKAVTPSTRNLAIEASASAIQSATSGRCAASNAIDGQYLRIIVEKPYAYLTLAEVEVYAEQSHSLTMNSVGTPVSPEYYPGPETWSPDDSFQVAFGGQTSEGTWTLAIQDLAPEVPNDFDTALRPTIHGAGAISDWVLYVTNSAGKVRRYDMDVKARIQTLPRYGKLYVDVAETEAEHLDRDQNGVLDLMEANRYLSQYFLSYDVLPTETRLRVLWDFFDGIRPALLLGIHEYLALIQPFLVLSFELRALGFHFLEQPFLLNQLGFFQCDTVQ